MPYRCTIQPTEEPVTLAEAKAALRIDDSADDNDIVGLIATARRTAEARTGRAFATQTWKLTADLFPGNLWPLHRACDRNYGWWRLGHGPERTAIYLPMGRAQSVTSVKYVDTSGVEQTLVADTDYLVDLESEPSRIVPAYGKCWPVPRCQPGAVRVTFVVGYGTAADVPDNIKRAIIVLAGHLYENRTEDAAEPKAVQSLLAEHVVFTPPDSRS